MPTSDAQQVRISSDKILSWDDHQQRSKTLGMFVKNIQGDDKDKDKAFLHQYLVDLLNFGYYLCCCPFRICFSEDECPHIFHHSSWLPQKVGL